MLLPPVSPPVKTMAEGQGIVGRIAAELADVAPTAGWVLLTMVAGVVTAWALRRATRWLVRRVGLEALGERAGVSKVLYAIGIKEGLAVFFGQLVFWAALLLTLSVVADLLGLPGLAALSAGVMAYLPRLLSGFAVLLAGLWAAGVVEGVVRNAPRLAAPAAVARAAYYLVLVVTFTLAAEQVGLDTGLVTMLIGIAVGGGVFALAASFAGGSREVFSNLIARHYCQSTLRLGDRICVESLEGTIRQFTALAVLLEQDDGHQVLVPCARLVREAVVVKA